MSLVWCSRVYDTYLEQILAREANHLKVNSERAKWSWTQKLWNQSLETGMFGAPSSGAGLSPPYTIRLRPDQVWRKLGRKMLHTQRNNMSFKFTMLVLLAKTSFRCVLRPYACNKHLQTAVFFCFCNKPTIFNFKLTLFVCVKFV